MKSLFQYLFISPVRAKRILAGRLASGTLLTMLLLSGFGNVTYAQVNADQSDAKGVGQAVEKSTFTHEQKQELADHALHILGGNANVISRLSLIHI